MSKKYSEFLEFETVKFSFIYDFVFSIENWNKINESFFSGIPNERLGWLPSKVSSNIIENQKFLWVDIDSLITGSSWNPEKDSFSKPVSLTKDDCLVNLSILIRLKNTGLGTITICVDKNDCITDYNQLSSFMQLVPTTWNHVIDNTIEESSNDKNYVTKIKSTYWEGEYTLQHIFFKALKSLNIILGVDDIISDSDNSIFGNLKPNKLAELISLNTSNDFPHPKTIDPYVHFAGKIEETFYNNLFLDKEESNKKNRVFSEAQYNNYVKQIIGILFRFFDPVQHLYLSMDYIKKEFDFSRKLYESINPKEPRYSRLISNNVNSNYFSYIHRMSSISLYGKNKGIPFEMIDKSLNDMLENSRAKLRGLNHANSKLDELIEKLNGNNYNVSKVKELFSYLIEIQKMTAQSLADLNVLLYDGQVAYDIMELVYDKLNVNYLSKSIFDKITIVRNLIEDYRANEILKKVN